MYEYMYTHMYIYIYTYVHVHVHVHICIHTYIYIQIRTYIYLYINVNAMWTSAQARRKQNKTNDVLQAPVQPTKTPRAVEEHIERERARLHSISIPARTSQNQPPHSNRSSGVSGVRRVSESPVCCTLWYCIYIFSHPAHLNFYRHAR